LNSVGTVAKPALVTGAILAGGAARRLGGVPKGLIDIAGSRMIDRVARALRAVTERLVIVSSGEGASSWLIGVEVVPDEQPGGGAMAGIASALRATRTDVLVVAWDMSVVSGVLLAPLVTAGGDNDAVMWSSASGVEPLAALYRQSALPVIDEALARGVRRARDVASLLRVRLLSELPAGCPPESFLSVNTPDDLARAQRLAANEGSPLGAR
jgi:molybdopterin-guanine dinucleotide biosynthesis protein A